MMAKIAATGATLSTQYHNNFPASNAVDGNMQTLIASKWQRNAWVSMHVAHGTTIDHVAVYNRIDNQYYASWLGQFEIWVGSSVGDTTSASAIKCAGPIEAPWHGRNVRVPLVVSCLGAVGEYVTLLQVGNARYLTITQLEAYATSAQPSISSATSASIGKGDTVSEADAHEAPVQEDSIYYSQPPMEPQLPTPPSTSSAAATSNEMGLSFALAGALALVLLAFLALLACALSQRRQLRSMLDRMPATKMVAGSTCGLENSITIVASELSAASNEGSIAERSHSTITLSIDEKSHGSLPPGARDAV